MKFWIMLVGTALFIAGCAPQAPTVTAPVVAETNTTKVVKKKRHVTKEPKKDIELKEVQDDNYSSAYMYPEGKVKKEKVVKTAEVESTSTIASTAHTMNKEECVSMIGQVKFDKYTQMFGDEASSIKRCAMLKAM